MAKIKTSKLYFKLVLVLFILFGLQISKAHSQDDNTALSVRPNFIGIQINPFFNENFFDELIAGNLNHSIWVFSARYGRESVFLPNLTIGGEFHQHRTFRAEPGYSFLTLGPFARYTHRLFSWAGVFAEAASKVSYSVVKVPALGIENRDFGFVYYFAPGISLGQQQKRFSIDLYWKFSGEMLIDGNNNVFSFKINYHF